MVSKSRGSGSGINLGKPSEPSQGAIDLGKKDEQPTTGGRGLGVGIERQLGTIGGFDVEAEVSADIRRLLPGGRLDLGVTKTAEGATEVEAGIGGRIATPLGGFGASTSGKISINPNTGAIEVESITGRVEAGGVSIEAAVDPDTGKTSLEVCYTFGIVSTCISIKPDEDDKKGVIPPEPIPDPITDPAYPPSPTAPNTSFKVGDCIYIEYWHRGKVFENYQLTTSFDIKTPAPPAAGAWSPAYKVTEAQKFVPNNILLFVGYFTGGHNASAVLIKSGTDAQKEAIASQKAYRYVYGRYYPNGYISFVLSTDIFYVKINGEWIYRATITEHAKTCQCPGEPPKLTLAPPLPNPPQKPHMNDECCKKIDKMYKILGIEKFERNKFDVANAFLVAGGQGNTKCMDLYELLQSIVQMLANGLILNPKCAPGGLPWESANASAWAGQMYEMQAESMSDGNQSQKVEVAVMYALAQQSMMIAEISEKVKFLADAIGLQPEPVPKSITIPFTIHEQHKPFTGFDPRKKGVPPKPKEIDVTAATKTDESTEKTISKMLFPSQIPIISWQFNPEHNSIIETLRDS
ncbi:hypothetical protein QUB05_21025 [Microcoleus sp. F10-C6]|uniref:hypothetical protein n=1 Tax=unclassified Microcoleus TaxID=2642155 RepID=UPI002FD2905F